MKVMLSLRIEEALREHLEAEAQTEQRNLTNMLEVILGQRYAALGAGSGVPGVEHAGTETPGLNLPEPAPSADSKDWTAETPTTAAKAGAGPPPPSGKPQPKEFKPDFKEGKK